MDFPHLQAQTDEPLDEAVAAARSQLQNASDELLAARKYVIIAVDAAVIPKTFLAIIQVFIHYTLSQEVFLNLCAVA